MCVSIITSFFPSATSRLVFNKSRGICVELQINFTCVSKFFSKLISQIESINTGKWQMHVTPQNVWLIQDKASLRGVHFLELKELYL